MCETLQRQEQLPTILVVEDSLTQAKRLERLLRQNGYDVNLARNGALGLEAARRVRPTVVISDVMMPEMDGFEMCRALKADRELREIPVVLLTSLSDPKDVICGLQCGADNFLTKPYDDAHLLRRLKHIETNLELRRAGQTHMTVEVFFAGQYHKLTADRIQIIDLLLSTFEAAVLQNNQLQKLTGDYRNALDDVKRAQANFQTLMETTADAVVVVGSDGNVRYVNPAAELLFDRSGSEMMGRPFLFDVDEEGNREIAIPRGKGEPLVGDMRVVSSNWDGEIVRLATIRDITEMVHLRKRLEIEAITDALTGLYNRRGFLALGEKALSLADRMGFDALCLFADLDGFKAVNDSYGHDEGDRVLIKTAAVLREIFREADIIGRVGGDEFAVLVIHGGFEGPDVDAIRRRLDDALRSVRDSDCPHCLSMSLGHRVRRHGENLYLTDLMAAADQKMYEQKEARRRASAERES
jgi:two-component system cell cycle response regulator